MAKKIVILNGSPRPNGNTSALTAQFKKVRRKRATPSRSFISPT